MHAEAYMCRNVDIFDAGVHMSVFVICTCRYLYAGMCSCMGALYVAIYARGQDRDKMKDCHMCGNAATDHFYDIIILWAQDGKCVTCLCFSGYAPVVAKRMMK